MTVTADLASSLDGYIAGTDVAVDNPGGDGAEPLFEWIKEGGTTFTFVTDGIHSALDRARAAAGGRNVDIAGGASAVQQYLGEGLVDELQLHVVPVLLGAGLRLFEGPGAGRRDLEPVSVVATPLATHLKHRFVK